ISAQSCEHRIINCKSGGPGVEQYRACVRAEPRRRPARRAPEPDPAIASLTPAQCRHGPLEIGARRPQDRRINAQLGTSPVDGDERLGGTADLFAAPVGVDSEPPPCAPNESER